MHTEDLEIFAAIVTPKTARIALSTAYQGFHHHLGANGKNTFAAGAEFLNYPNKLVALYGRIPNVGMVPQIDVMIRPANTYRLYLKPDLTLLQLSRLDLVRHQVSRALRNVRFVHDGYSSSFLQLMGEGRRPRKADGRLC